MTPQEANALYVNGRGLVRYNGRARYATYRDGTRVLIPAKAGVAAFQRPGLERGERDGQALIEFEAASGYARLWVPLAEIERLPVRP